MFKVFKRWLYWWKLSRKSKRFFKEEIMLAKHRGPLEFDEKTRDAIIADWKKQGIDITKPNFGLDNGQITWQ